MEKMILSLKNIYKLLMTNDFPIYSESVISEKNRKGQTLVRFWQSQLIEEFRCLPCGKMIWRNDGKRNRYMSNLCNRSTELKIYSRYAKELASQVSDSSLLNQIDRFVKFLSEREYKHDILIRRIQEIVRLWDAEDTHVSGEMVYQINSCLADSGWLLRYGVQGNLFQAGYLLTLLTVYAAAGEAMDDPVLAVLHEECYSIQSMWEAHMGRREQEKNSTLVMTVHAGMLQDNPLPQNRFFGREEELYDLQELAVTGHKCLISGIGGIGKTELLRQLVRRVTEEHLVDKLAIVPYESGIVESFARAFPGFERSTPEESFGRCIRLLNREAENGSRVLLLIDNMNNSPEQDENLKQLSELNCGVLITTRRAGMETFETYRLPNPSVTTGTLIFRDNYGHPLTQRDRERLSKLLEDEALCHPLTLRLMAKAAYNKNWSLIQLEDYLKKKEVSLTWTEGEREVRLDEMYAQLYSLLRIPEACQDIAELFTLLPVGSYSREFLGEYFPDIAGKDEETSARLSALTEGGWLDGDGSGYFMHPLIAQCLRRKVINEARVEPAFHKIKSELLKLEAADLELSNEDEFLQICSIYRYMVSFVSGSVSPEMVQAFACSVSYGEYSDQFRQEMTQRLELLEKRCSNTMAICCHRALCRWNAGDTKEAMAEYHRQKETLTVSKTLFYDFCLALGYQLKFNKETEMAEKLFLEILDGEAIPVQKATACFYLYEVNLVKGDAAAANRWGRQGAEYAKSHPECGEALIFTNIFALGASSLTLRDSETVGAAVAELKGLLSEQSPAWRRSQYEALAGAYEREYGSPEKAIVHIEWQRDYVLEYRGKGFGYYNTLGQLASTLGRLKRYDEAIANYSEAIQFARENNFVSMLQQFSNNLANVYLSMEKPDEALKHLQVAETEGRKLGGIALAEALRNTARAYGQLGESGPELEYLKEAVPLLKQVYGEKNPRYRESAERLSQLELCISAESCTCENTGMTSADETCTSGEKTLTSGDERRRDGI